MSKKNWRPLVSRRPVIVAALALAAFGLAGCTTYAESNEPPPLKDGKSAAEADQSPGTGQDQDEETEPTLADAEPHWGGYTMSIDMVTDDVNRMIISPGQGAEGQFIKIVFAYQDDPAASGGFVMESLHDDIKANPITLVGPDGTVYQNNGSIGDVSIKGSGEISDIELDDYQARFSITFDVPADLAIEDFKLDTGSGDPIALMPYISDEYLEKYPDED